MFHNKHKVPLITLFLILFFAPLKSTLAQAPCGGDLDSLPILAGGRSKPLLSHAQDELRFLTGKNNPTGVGSSLTYCLLSLTYLMPPAPELNALIEHPELKKILKMSEEEKYISYPVLIGKEFDIRAQYFSHKEKDALKRAMEKIMRQIQIYQSIVTGEDWKLMQKDSSGVFSWVSIKDLVSDLTAVSSSLETSRTLYIQEHGEKYLWELTYLKAHLFSWAIGVSLLAFSLLVLSQKQMWGIIFAGTTVLIQIIAVAMRVYISGRAPITNMYETVMFSGLGALIISLVVGHFRKEKVFVIAGLAYNILCLLMMSFANNMLSPSIAPLVPVLRDNFWLSTHVTTIILSYAALALSWVLANMALFKMRFKNLNVSEVKFEVQTIGICLKVGVVLLAAGIILGGVWADYSWGRFWGWDPKETWSLIVLLVYMAILHGRYTKWINDRRFVALSALSFLSVMMAWFGVNYILASGLHSYGFSEGGAIFLISFFTIQILFLIFSLTPFLKKPAGQLKAGQ